MSRCNLEVKSPRWRKSAKYYDLLGAGSARVVPDVVGGEDGRISMDVEGSVPPEIDELRRRFDHVVADVRLDEGPNPAWQMPIAVLGEGMLNCVHKVMTRVSVGQRRPEVFQRPLRYYATVPTFSPWQRT